MSLNIIINPSQEVVVQAQITRTTDFITVERIMDFPGLKRISVETQEFGNLILENLSGENYNNPPWTDEMIVDAIKTKLGIK